MKKLILSTTLIFMMLLTGCATNMGQTQNTPAQKMSEACIKGDKGRVEKILSEGLDINTKSEGYTALYRAAQHGKKEIVELLITRGADVDFKSSYYDSDMTALYIAAANGHKDVVEFLIANKADVNASGYEQLTPLYVAAHGGHVAIVKFLLEHGANPNLLGKRGYMPLYAATLSNKKDVSEEITKLLIAHGADITSDKTLTRWGYTPLGAAASKGDKTFLEFLITHGADVNSRSDFGRTALHVLLGTVHDDFSNQVELARILVAHGANVNARDNAGNTPLHYAKAIPSYQMVDLLIANGADEHIRNNEGNTPEMYGVIALKEKADSSARAAERWRNSPMGREQAKREAEERRDGACASAQLEYVKTHDVKDWWRKDLVPECEYQH